jgi:hypothetical protein
VNFAISAINAKGSRKVALSSPFARVEFETTKFRSRRFLHRLLIIEQALGVAGHFEDVDAFL